MQRKTKNSNVRVINQICVNQLQSKTLQKRDQRGIKGIVSALTAEYQIKANITTALQLQSSVEKHVAATITTTTAQNLVATLEV